MDIKKLIENAELFLQVEKQMKKSFSENNKLQKQSGLVTSTSPVFISHCIFNKIYVVSYIRLYDDAVGELKFDELSSLLNPELCKKGVFLISSKFEQYYTCCVVWKLYSFIELLDDSTFVFCNA